MSAEANKALANKTLANKALAHRLNDEVFNNGDLDVLDELLAPTYVNRTAPPDMPPGASGTKAFVTMFRSAFPDLHITLDDVIVDGEKVVTRWNATGTHQGTFFGIAPTGKHIKFSGIDILRIVDGKITEHWDLFDQMGLMDQLRSASSR